MKQTSHPDRSDASLARAWWRSLQSDESGRGGDRAALAQLRRCTTPEEAATVPAALALARRLGITDAGEPRLPDVLAAAVVLAHLRDDDRSMHPARRLGGSDPILSPLRFARLLQADTPTERIAAFRRAGALADRRLDIGRLAAAVLDWPHHRTAWAFEYHGAEPPAADSATETPTEEMPA